MRQDLSNANTITPFAKTILDDTDAASVLTTLGISSFTQEQILTLSNIVSLQNLLGLNSLLSAGMVQYYAGVTAPAGWLVCDGTPVSRTTYSALYAAIGEMYGVGDGSTTFNLPDLRGEFIRGNDEGRGVDVGRTVGSTQSSQNLAHTHTIKTTEGVTGDDSAFSCSWGSARLLLANRNVCGGGNTTISGAYAVSSGGTEARPRNISLLPCIKY
jgi:microcystin-dependent protein